MSEVYNIYCDESCHLEHDGQGVMVIGALWCPDRERKRISVRLGEIKAKHNLNPGFEVKWGKISPSKAQFYLDWLDYFFDDDHLNFRAVIIPAKSELRHEDFGQTHDHWYYKMYFTLLTPLLSPECRYRIYIDHKDTHSSAKVRQLQDVLCNSTYDFDRQIIQRVQSVLSYESDLIQLCDLLTGAISYFNRRLVSNAGKVAMVERMRQRSGYHLDRTTLLKARKINLLKWQAEGVHERPSRVFGI